MLSSSSSSVFPRLATDPSKWFYLCVHCFSDDVPDGLLFVTFVWLKTNGRRFIKLIYLRLRFGDDGTDE
jgi:hypothetical protein